MVPRPARRGSASYNVPAALCFSGPLDIAALAASLDAIVRRQAALRTTFAGVEGLPAQVVHALAAPLPHPLVDLAALPAPRDRRAAASGGR